MAAPALWLFVRLVAPRVIVTLGEAVTGMTAPGAGAAGAAAAGSIAMRMQQRGGAAPAMTGAGAIANQLHREGWRRAGGISSVIRGSNSVFQRLQPVLFKEFDTPYGQVVATVYARHGVQLTRRGYRRSGDAEDWIIGLKAPSAEARSFVMSRLQSRGVEVSPNRATSRIWADDVMRSPTPSPDARPGVQALVEAIEAMPGG